MKTFCIFISLIGINRFEPTVRVHDIVVLIFLLIFSIILLLNVINDKCAFYNCKMNRRNSKNVIFHEIPKDTELAKKWILSSGRNKIWINMIFYNNSSHSLVFQYFILIIKEILSWKHWVHKSWENGIFVLTILMHLCIWTLMPQIVDLYKTPCLQSIQLVITLNKLLSYNIYIYIYTIVPGDQ